MNTMDLIADAHAMPNTHRVITTYSNGRTRTHDTRSAGSAANYAVGERRKLGRELIDRETGATARVVSVNIVEI